jgi:signal transduction histidine kinase/CheY-like chemotaxis protein
MSSLLSRLFVLVAVAMLPAIAIQAYNEIDLRRTREVEVHNEALGLAKLAAAEQQQIVQGVRQALIALSELPAIKAKDADGCHAYLSRIKERYPEFIVFIVFDMNGSSFCDSSSELKPTTAAGRAFLASVLKTGEFTIGEFAVGRRTGRNVLHFALPFYGDDNRVGGVVMAALSLDWLADYIAQKSVPEGAALSITDRNGTYLARYPDNGRYVGGKLPAGKGPILDDGTVADKVSIDGVRRIVGFAAVGRDLLVSFGLDKAKAFTKMESRTQRDILLIALSTLIVLSLTVWGAQRFIQRPFAQLVDAANQWRRGEFSRRVDIQGNSEIERVASAFNTMADALKHREHELSEAKKKAEEAASRITMIFESTTDSVLIIDRNWRISYLNGQAWSQIAEGRDLIDVNLSEVVSEVAEADDLSSQLREAMSEQRPVFAEAFCTRKNIWYAISAFPSSQGLAMFVRDITDHKHALEERRLIEEQFHQSQKMESVGQLTGGVAHDFNNLLTVVSANLELIQVDDDIVKARHFAAAAQRAIDRGAKVTAQLLAFSRRQVLNPRPVNANQLVCEFQGLVRHAVGEACQVKLQTDEGLWLCHVDPALLETALLNLAVNARDAMPDGGVLEIEMRNIVVDAGAVAGCLPGWYVRLSVRDTGCGMPPEVRDRVFEPFFTTKEVGKGTGLGLSMVYGFVRQSGGHIAIETALGKGTTVALYLPRATHKPAAEMEDVQPQAIPAGSERILVVEDNDDLLDLTSAILTKSGYEVRCARNGTEALRMIQSEEFDLLLSDIVMPNGINGIEVAREARRLNRCIKVLLASGYAGDVLERHQAVGEFPIIDKPFRMSELAARLRSILHDG